MQALGPGLITNSSLPRASDSHARNRDTILGKVQLASLWLASSRVHRRMSTVSAIGQAVMLSVWHTSVPVFYRDLRLSISFQYSFSTDAVRVTSNKSIGLNQKTVKITSALLPLSTQNRKLKGTEIFHTQCLLFVLEKKNGCYFLLRCLCNKMLSKCLKYFLFMPLSNLGFNATFYSRQISFSNSCSLQKGLEIFPRAHWKFQLKIRSCQSQTKGNKEETAPSPPY